MKKLIAPLIFLSTLIPTSVLASIPEWYGSADWEYSVICIDGPSNARLSPDFSNNIRAELVDGTCGNPISNNGRLIYENNFYLIEFYIHNLNEHRRYWVHETQIERFYR